MQAAARAWKESTVAIWMPCCCCSGSSSPPLPSASSLPPRLPGPGSSPPKESRPSATRLELAPPKACGSASVAARGLRRCCRRCWRCRCSSCGRRRSSRDRTSATWARKKQMTLHWPSATPAATSRSTAATTASASSWLLALRPTAHRQAAAKCKQGRWRPHRRGGGEGNRSSSCCRHAGKINNKQIKYE